MRFIGLLNNMELNFNPPIHPHQWRRWDNKINVMEKLEKEILKAVESSLTEVMKNTLGGYSSPLSELMRKVVEKHSEAIEVTVDSAFKTVIDSGGFKETVLKEFEHKVAKLLLAKLEGSVEKAVNAIRNNPSNKAKMLLAVERLVDDAIEDSK